MLARGQGGPLLVAVLLMFAAPLAAEDVDCENAFTQHAMNRCAHQSYLQADHALNDAYQQAVSAAQAMDEYLAEGDIAAETLLRDAQRAWITYRDKACEVESLLFRGGSMQPLIYSTCLERETQSRTEALRLFAEAF